MSIEIESISIMCELCYITTPDKNALENPINKVHTIDKEGLKTSKRHMDVNMSFEIY